MMKMPNLTPLAASLPAAVPFVGPETQERASGHVFKARLGANENGFGPSPRAIAAMQRAASDAWMYADPESHDLRQVIARHHGVDPENVIVGEGIDTLLALVVRLFVGPGDAVVTSAGAYPTFNYHVTGFGGALHMVPYTDDHEDPDALIAKAVETGAKMIYFANPDNPMGTWHDAATVARMITNIPDDCLLILDEAYIEFAPDGTAPPIDVTHTNVVRMRTFSKAYAMAGVRVGYAISHAQVIDTFHKVRNHFGMSRMGQAGALAALQDADWLQTVQRNVGTARDTIAAIARTNGLAPLPSATNFVTIDCGADGAYARAVLAGLIAQGIFVRMPFVAPQDRCIRVSCGTPGQLALFADALPKAIAAAS